MEAELRNGEDLGGDAVILWEQEVVSFPVARGISFAQGSEWQSPDDPTLCLAQVARRPQLTPDWGSDI